MGVGAGERISMHYLVNRVYHRVPAGSGDLGGDLRLAKEASPPQYMQLLGPVNSGAMIHGSEFGKLMLLRCGT
jgi:hypothetical protein